MYKIMCILLPSLISIKVDNMLSKKNFNNIDTLLNYGIYCLINNMLTMAFCVLILNIEDLIQNINIYAGVIVKYIAVSIIISIISSFIKVFVVKNVGVEIEVKKK
jgi:hypothetical protein